MAHLSAKINQGADLSLIPRKIVGKIALFGQKELGLFPADANGYNGGLKETVRKKIRKRPSPTGHQSATRGKGDDRGGLSRGGKNGKRNEK